MRQKVAVRGLAHAAAWIFFVWGGLMAGKGVWDGLGGEPEANIASAQPWQFVTRQQWRRYAGFELTYGLACLGLGAAARVYGRRLPEYIERETSKDEI